MNREIHRILVFVVLLHCTTTSTTDALSLFSISGINYQPNQNNNNKPLTSSRRNVFRSVIGAVITSCCTTTITKDNSMYYANAACLTGDLSPECIGVYKVPMDELYRVLPDNLSKEEALKRYAPDIKYVPPMQNPKSMQDAMDILTTQRIAAEDIKNVVADGKLEEAGIKVLNLLSQLKAGTMAINSMRNTYSKNDLINDTIDGNSASTRSTAVINEIRLNKAESQFQELQVAWGSIDVMIGQALRGDLGVSAVAQIMILSEIKEGIRVYDDFLSSIQS